MIGLITTLTVIGIILLHGSSIPQFIRNYKRKTTDDVSIGLWLMLWFGYLILGIVAVLEKSKVFMWVYGIGIINISSMIIHVLYYRK